MAEPMTDERLAEIRAALDGTAHPLTGDPERVVEELLAEVDRLREDRVALLRWLRRDDPCFLCKVNEPGWHDHDWADIIEAGEYLDYVGQADR